MKPSGRGVLMTGKVVVNAKPYFLAHTNAGIGTAEPPRRKLLPATNATATTSQTKPIHVLHWKILATLLQHKRLLKETNCATIHVTA
jgi:hypothetical protein